jgi:hypothetical protein
MKFDRAWRRAQNERLKKNRKSYWTASHWENDGRRFGFLLNNPKTCSCHMCGNPRKYYDGKPESFTIQERRAAQKGLYHDALDFLRSINEQNLPPEEC